MQEAAVVAHNRRLPSAALGHAEALEVHLVREDERGESGSASSSRATPVAADAAAPPPWSVVSAAGEPRRTTGWTLSSPGRALRARPTPSRARLAAAPRPPVRGAVSPPERHEAFGRRRASPASARPRLGMHDDRARGRGRACAPAAGPRPAAAKGPALVGKVAHRGHHRERCRGLAHSGGRRRERRQSSGTASMTRGPRSRRAPPRPPRRVARGGRARADAAAAGARPPPGARPHPHRRASPRAPPGRRPRRESLGGVQGHLHERQTPSSEELDLKPLLVPRRRVFRAGLPAAAVHEGRRGRRACVMKVGRMERLRPASALAVSASLEKERITRVLRIVDGKPPDVVLLARQAQVLEAVDDEDDAALLRSPEASSARASRQGRREDRRVLEGSVDRLEGAHVCGARAVSCRGS